MRKMRKRGFLGLLGFAVLLLVGAACSSDPETITVIEKVEVPGETIIVEKEVVKTVIEKVEVPGETVVVEKEVIKTVDVEKIVTVEKEIIREVTADAPETILTVRMANMSPQFTPHTQGRGDMAQIGAWIWSRIAQADPTAGQWSPDLAQRWSLADDFSSMTFHLRANATWHDGTPVTAADIDYTVRSFLNPEQSSWMLATMTAIKGGKDFQDGVADTVSGITILDDVTVEIAFEAPSINFLDDLNNLCGLAPVPVLPAHKLDAIPGSELFEDDFWKNDMVGSGPWEFVQWVPDQFLEMTAFDGFYFGRPNIDRIIMAIIPSGDATQIAMQRGEVTVNVRGGVSVEAQEAFLADPRFDVWATMGTHSGGWSFNMRQPIINDPRLHQAWAYALDRATLFQIFANGLGKLVQTPLTHSWYQKSEWDAMYPYDPDKARALLAEMGWDNNRVIKVLASPLTNENNRAMAAAVQQYLADVGIKIEYDEKEGAAWSASFYTNHDWEAANSGGGGTQGGPGQYLGGRWITCPAPSCDPWGYSAYTGWDDLIFEGMAITDRVAAAAHWQMIQEDYMMVDLPIVGGWITAGVKIKNQEFEMPILGSIPKPQNLSDIKVYPVHIGRDDNWSFHPEGWRINQ
jgi:ABC-type transport system substrate-binding protein